MAWRAEAPRARDARDALCRQAQARFHAFTPVPAASRESSSSSKPHNMICSRTGIACRLASCHGNVAVWSGDAAVTRRRELHRRCLPRRSEQAHGGRRPCSASGARCGPRGKSEARRGLRRLCSAAPSPGGSAPRRSKPAAGAYQTMPSLSLMRQTVPGRSGWQFCSRTVACCGVILPSVS